MTRKKHRNDEVNEEQILDQAEVDDAASDSQNVVGDEKMSDENNIADKSADQIEVNSIEQIQTQLEDMKDKYLRLSAEFDNYRKRSLREKMDLTKYASEEVLQSILPVFDDFERAMKSTDSSTDIEAIKQGLHLITGKFSDFLKSKGVVEIEAIGKEFNTDIHEAITKIPVQDEGMKGKVVDVVQKGYMLNDKVIRYSKVVIGE